MTRALPPRRYQREVAYLDALLAVIAAMDADRPLTRDDLLDAERTTRLRQEGT